MSRHVQSIGPYRLVERIGAGGMAVVYRATRHGASGFSKAFALKVLLPEHEHDAELQRLLIAEAKLGAAMSHRNLVGVFDLGVEDGRYFAAMELVDGGDLRTLRGDEALTELATGVRPFDAATPVETMDRIRDGAPELSGLDDDLRVLVARCLQRDPTDRFASMRSVIEALRDVRREHAPASSPELAVPAGGGRGRRRPSPSVIHTPSGATRVRENICPNL